MWDSFNFYMHAIVCVDLSLWYIKWTNLQGKYLNLKIVSKYVAQNSIASVTATRLR